MIPFSQISNFKFEISNHFFRLDPFAVLANQVHAPVHRLDFGDIEFNGGLADVEIDFARGAANVTEVGVRYLAGAIDDAAHDGDFDALEMLGARFDSGGDGLEIEEGAPAG